MNTKQNTIEQLTTFYIGSDLFGIEVMKVQEVFRNPSVVPVPLAPNFVRGLINLRGQIATALGLRELFGRPTTELSDQMSVVCKIDGNLVSVIVDSIGDVVEVDGNRFEAVPETIPLNIRRYIKGIFKMDGVLLSVIDLDQLSKELSPAMESLN
ncbi:MAG: chemotaxis protein CheW [Bacteriovoracaceae bacterium]|nr:chemotaxis protein CheW [Bacteriovoracaceae bacterium]